MHFQCDDDHEPREFNDLTYILFGNRWCNRHSAYTTKAYKYTVYTRQYETSSLNSRDRKYAYIGFLVVGDLNFSFFLRLRICDDMLVCLV